MVHWPTQAAINQLTMRAATLALAFAATAAGLVAPSHAKFFSDANCLPGGFCEIEQPYPPELLAVVDLTVTTQNLVLACDSIADSIVQAQSLVVAGIIYAGAQYEYSINTMTGFLDCTTFVPLPVYSTEPTFSKCFLVGVLDGFPNFGPDFCPKTSAAGPMPAPGDE